MDIQNEKTKKLAHEISELIQLSPITQEEELHKLGQDKWFVTARPDIGIVPQSTEEVSKILQYATKNRISVTTRGSGYGYVGGCVPVHGGILLDMRQMNQIEEISSSDFLAVVQPGVITGDLQKSVKKFGLFYPPDPASLNYCSIGGNLATNAGGPRSLKYGSTSSFILGLDVVLANGTVINLGSRAHKNKTGFDLLHLFVGSEGMLGIITKAILRLLPHPPARSLLCAGFANLQAGGVAIQSIFSSGIIPSALEIADKFTLETTRNQSKHQLPIPDGETFLLVEVDGQAESVLCEGESIYKILKANNAIDIFRATNELECEQIWSVRQSFSDALRNSGLIKLNEDVVVPRGKIVDFILFIENLQKQSPFPIACFGHAGDGNIHVNIMVSEHDFLNRQEIINDLLNKVFSQILAWKGSITGEHGIGLAKKNWWSQATTESADQLHKTIKSALDPLHLLNPGKFLSP